MEKKFSMKIWQVRKWHRVPKWKIPYVDSDVNYLLPLQNVLNKISPLLQTLQPAIFSRLLLAMLWATKEGSQCPVWLQHHGNRAVAAESNWNGSQVLSSGRMADLSGIMKKKASQESLIFKGDRWSGGSAWKT